MLGRCLMGYLTPFNWWKGFISFWFIDLERTVLRCLSGNGDGRRKFK